MTTDFPDPGIDLDSELLARIAQLPDPEPEPDASERIRRRARAAFIGYSQRAQHPWWDRLTRIYSRVEPFMAAAVSSVYLLWAFTRAMSLYQ